MCGTIEPLPGSWSPILDIVSFGTFKAPEQETVVATGLEDDPVPPGFLKQLALPVTPRDPWWVVTSSSNR